MPRKTPFLVILGALIAVSCGRSEKPESVKPSQPTAKIAPGFQAKTLDGKNLNFPGDYKGKVVLLDFWATWCGPCREELPNVVAAYQRYHWKGLEVIGVSLDRPRAELIIDKYIRDHDMLWPQIYDGGYWQAELALRYGVRSIPRPILLDGDTGAVLAQGPAARGPNLALSVERALANKGKK